MKNLYLTGVISLLVTSACAQLPWKNLPAEPALFPEASTELNERDMAISPDGSEMFYTLQGNQNSFSVILYRKRLADQTWSLPEVASFSGKFGDLEPAFTADGKKLFFSSNRPATGDKPKDYDIWSVTKINGRWSDPKNLGEKINTAGNEFYPSAAANGNLYFTAEYEKGVGKEDIYISRWSNGSYEESVALDTAVNSKRWEFNAFVSPDEQFILFTAYGRKDDMGGGDLYMSLKDPKGAWQPAKPLTMLNSGRLDYCPFVSHDKKVLFFTSARHGIPKSFEVPLNYQALMTLSHGIMNGSENIYWIDFESVMKSMQD